MKKYFIILSIFAISLVIYAQQLTFSINGILPIDPRIETINELNYYYADDINSQYKVNPEDVLRARSIISIKPGFRNMLNDNWFVNYEISYLSFLKTIKILYNTRHINNVNLDTRFNYSYLSNTLTGGYRFLHIKEVRPKLYTGISLYSLIRFKEIGHRADENKLINLYPYGQIIHQEISAIKNNFLAYTIGFGLEYYLLNFNIEYVSSMTKLGAKNSIYKNFNVLYFSTGLNLKTFLIISKKIKNYKKTLNR